MISRTTVSLKKLRGKHLTVEGKRYRVVKIKKPRDLPKGSAILIPSTIKSGGSKMAKRKPGRPKGSKTKKGRKKKRSLPPRIKTGKRKGQFRKRKGKKKKKKRGNPNNCW